jgi:beta-phosphoglucomutase-like phosphatase (HAD superfamily)
MKTIIFDMDGVIVDSEPFHCEAWIETYQEVGIPIDERYYYSRICGQHGMVSTAMVLNDFNIEISQEELIRRKEEIVSLKVMGKILPISGAKELTINLKNNGYKIGLASSTSYVGVMSILKNIGMEDFFSVIHAGEAVKNGKPNPDIYLKTAKILEELPQNCVVVEDSSSGVISAKKAGMKVIGILNGRNDKEQLQFADRIVDNFSEITLDLLNTL